MVRSAGAYGRRERVRIVVRILRITESSDRAGSDRPGGPPLVPGWPSGIMRHQQSNGQVVRWTTR